MRLLPRSIRPSSILCKLCHLLRKPGHPATKPRAHSRAGTSRISHDAADGPWLPQKLRRPSSTNLTSLRATSLRSQPDTSAQPAEHRVSSCQFAQCTRAVLHVASLVQHHSARRQQATNGFTCTARYHPVRMICAMPHAPLRSVLFGIAPVAAFAWRASMQTAAISAGVTAGRGSFVWKNCRNRLTRQPDREWCLRLLARRAWDHLSGGGCRPSWARWPLSITIGPSPACWYAMPCDGATCGHPADASQLSSRITAHDRGRRGLLLLHRSGLSLHTPCRSPGALTRVAACTLARPNS